MTPNNLCGNKLNRTDISVIEYLSAIQILKIWRENKFQKLKSINNKETKKLISDSNEDNSGIGKIKYIEKEEEPNDEERQLGSNKSS